MIFSPHYLFLFLEEGQLKREGRETEQEKYEVRRAERKWTTVVIRRKTFCLSSFPDLRKTAFTSEGPLNYHSHCT